MHIGASDDGASCAIMLEMLQLFSERKQPLRHDIIMLFNGAEENLMQVLIPYNSTNRENVF